MGINGITANYPKEYKTGRKPGGTYGADFEAVVQWKRNSLSQHGHAAAASKNAAVDIYNNMSRFGGYASEAAKLTDNERLQADIETLKKEKEKAQERSPQEHEPAEYKTDTQIVEKPDGSKVMMIIAKVGETEVTTCVEITKPTALPIMDTKRDYETYSSENYKIVPDNEAGCFTIYNKQGERLGAFHYADIKIRQDAAAGKQLLISEHGTMCYDALALDDELKKDLQDIMGVEALETEALRGYSLKTHPETGIQYLLKAGEEGRGGKVLLQNEEDIKKYDALAETYLQSYPSLIESKQEAYIWADLEIRGLARHTKDGILSIGYDGVSYNDNDHAENNWSIRFPADVYKLLMEHMQDYKEHIGDLQQLSTWKEMLGETEKKTTGPVKQAAAPLTETRRRARDYREQAFDQIAANAPESVKKAWLDAADKAGIDGLGISESGMLTHITQFMVQRCLREYRGENANDILGSSVQSAIKAANEALYALEHPMGPDYGRTPEQIRNREKEKIFYQEFLNRLFELY